MLPLLLNQKSMYRLKQTARLAYNDLVHHLQQYGYIPDKIYPNILNYKTCKTKFCLCVDTFGVKCFNQSDNEHLMNGLKQKYDITIDKSEKHFCDLT